MNDITESQIRHDFCLARNGHGAGFWIELGEFIDKLTAICRNYKKKNVFADGEGLIIIE